MSVAPSDLQIFSSAVRASDFTTANIGGAKGSSQITGSVLGEIFFMMESPLAGGADLLQYAKVGYYNANASTALQRATVWGVNFLDTLDAASPITATGTNAEDGSTKKFRVIGFDASGNPQQEERLLNGTTAVTTLLTFGVVDRVEVRDATTGLLTPVTGDVMLTAGTQALGMVPSTFKTATAEISIALAATLNDSGTTSTAATAPSGYTFSKPRTRAGGLAVANSGILTALAWQAIWCKWRLRAQAKPSEDVEIGIAIAGGTG